MVKKHRKHKTHLPDRFPFKTAEENVIAGIIMQAWCDAFMQCSEQSYIGFHEKKEQKTARQMFEGHGEWRRSLKNLCAAIQIQDTDLVKAYVEYKKMRLKGVTKISPAKAGIAFLKRLKEE